MKLRLKEDPREWRKSVWLTTLGLGLIGSLLKWRGALTTRSWLWFLAGCVLISVFAFLQPAWFRPYYRLSMRAGVALSRVVARVLLAVIFLVVVTPLGFLLRLLGKDLLGLKKPTSRETYWTDSRPAGPLDRMF
jgi:hypothetical protein